MRYVCVFLLLTSLLHAQENGEALYKQRCATCHDSPAARVPSLSTIKTMSSEAIRQTLTSGVMKVQAAGLSPQQISALIGYIGPKADMPTTTALASACRNRPPFPSDVNAPAWNGWSPGLNNSRFQSAAVAGLPAASVPKLKLKWAFSLGAISEARSQPAMIGNYVFIGSATSDFYALDVRSGCTLWAFHAASAIRGGAAIGAAGDTPAVFLTDAGANMYALDAQTGRLLWRVHPADHFTTVGTASPRYYKGIVYQTFSSFEEVLAGDPKYACCTFRGSVVAVKAATGEKIWQTFTIPEAPKPTQKNAAGAQQSGPSGAGIWSTPTIDERVGALYVGTGDNYSDPPRDTSDAVLALDLKTGAVRWSTQLTKNDAYNNGCAIPVPGNCPETHGADYDFGQPPILVDLGSKKRLLVIAQKSGIAYALDPDSKGKLVWQARLGKGGPLGGSQWGSASDGSSVYVAISDVGLGGVADKTVAAGFRLVLDPKQGGGLYALDAATGKIKWNAPSVPCPDGRTGCSPAQSAAVTAIPGVVFSGSVDGHLRAYSSATGKVLWETDTAREFNTVNGPPAHGGSLDVAGPAILNGTLLVNSGYGQWGGMPGNVLLAFSVSQ